MKKIVLGFILGVVTGVLIITLVNCFTGKKEVEVQTETLYELDQHGIAIDSTLLNESNLSDDDIVKLYMIEEGIDDSYELSVDEDDDEFITFWVVKDGEKGDIRSINRDYYAGRYDIN